MSAWWTGKSTRWRAARTVIASAVLIGLGGLIAALNVWVGVGAAILIVLAAWPVLLPMIAVVLLRVVGAFIVAALALVGVNVAVDELPDPPILCGLFAALLVFLPVAYWYLRGADWNKGVTRVAAVFLTLFAILGAPYLVSRFEGESTDVPEEKLVPSKIDVLIVTDGRPHPAPLHVPPAPGLGRFNARFAVGYADGDRVRWTQNDGASATEALRVAAQGSQITIPEAKPNRRPDADSVLLLLVDGTSPVTKVPEGLPNLQTKRDEGDEVARWGRVARDAAGPDTPAFALLQSTDQARVDLWSGFAARGLAVSLQTLGSLTATDAAIRLAVAAPTSNADFALAEQHRPVLLFDGAEPVPRPLSVDRMFEQGQVHLCRDERVATTDCPEEPIFDPAELRNGGTHLRLDRPGSKELREKAKADKEAARAAAPFLRPGDSAVGAPPVGTPPSGHSAVDR